ncbi:MAG: TRAP transporter small permease subunit [Arenibacterium sp.]
MDKPQSGGITEWIVPLAFVLCASWVIWHMPAYILTLAPHENPSLLGKVTALHTSKEVTPNLPGLFGGVADIIDWATLAALPLLLILGMRSVRVAAMEFEHWRPIDRFSLFFGRITMILILLMTCVMLYEVFLRYALEAPTLWANELTLWIAGFVFLVSGLYAMQQRCHIRIFILYDLFPRWLQRLSDIICVLLLWIFTFFAVYGSYKQVFITKFYSWEMFGTAFDPPIPATVQPAILIVLVLISIQAAINLVCDWNLAPERHAGAETDQEEIDAIKKSIGAD